MIYKIRIILLLLFFTYACGKVGPLNLPEEKLDKSIITYPCDTVCIEAFEAEKERQQKVILEAE